MPSGEGGHVRVPGTPTVDIFVEEWTLDKTIETPDVTDSGSAGYRQREATLKDGTGSAGLIWRLALSAEDQSLDVGDEAIVNLLLGSSGQAYALHILVNSVSTTNTAKGDVIRQRINFVHKQGGITGPVTAQAALEWVEAEYQRLMGQGTGAVLPQNQRQLGMKQEGQRGQGDRERGSNRGAGDHPSQRRDVPGQPANDPDVRCAETVGPQTSQKPPGGGGSAGQASAAGSPG